MQQQWIHVSDTLVLQQNGVHKIQTLMSPGDGVAVVGGNYFHHIWVQLGYYYFLSLKRSNTERTDEAASNLGKGQDA